MKTHMWLRKDDTHQCDANRPARRYPARDPPHEREHVRNCSRHLRELAPVLVAARDDAFDLYSDAVWGWEGRGAGGHGK